MKATLLMETRRDLADGRFAELRVWRVPQAVRGSTHAYKYSLALVANGACWR